jgi:hypothetical protein
MAGIVHGPTSSTMATTASVTVSATVTPTAHANPGTYAGGIMAVALPQGLHFFGGLFAVGFGGLLDPHGWGRICGPCDSHFLRPERYRPQERNQEDGGGQCFRAC